MIDLSLREIVGLTLWWTEGTKKRRDLRWENLWIYPVEITNTDPRMIEIFLDFLRNDIKIDEKRLKLQLQIHEGDDQKELEKFWLSVTKIPFDRFNKTIVRPKGNKVGKTKGTCKIRYNSKETYLRLEKMLNRSILGELLKDKNGV